MQNFNLQNKKDIKGIKQRVKLQDQSQVNCKKMLQLFMKKTTTANYTLEHQLIILQQKKKLVLFICKKEITAKEMKSKQKKILKLTIKNIRMKRINIMTITIMMIGLMDNNLMKQ